MRVRSRRPRPADAIDAHGLFKKSFGDLDLDAEAVRQELARPEPPFVDRTVESLVPDALRDEYAAYVRKFRYVSALCRLSIAEELCLLSMVDTDQSPALYNRRMFVRAVAHSDSGVPTPPISLRYPPQPRLPSFDAYAGQIYLALELDNSSEGWWSRFQTLSYARPDESDGASCGTQTWGSRR